MDIVSKITQIVGPSLEALGYDIVLIRMADGARRKTLMVMAERRDGQMMSFDDCTEISRTVSALLDVEDPITTAYNLEVCSPGIDRPLTKLADYTRFQGQEARIETVLPVDGRKRFRGVLQSVNKELITVAMPEGEAVIPFPQIRTAKLVPATDAVMKKASKKSRESSG